MNTMAPIRMEEQNNTQATGILTALKLKAPNAETKVALEACRCGEIVNFNTIH
jgi:hypothetical protein